MVIVKIFELVIGGFMLVTGMMLLAYNFLVFLFDMVMPVTMFVTINQYMCITGLVFIPLSFVVMNLSPLLAKKCTND